MAKREADAQKLKLKQEADAKKLKEEADAKLQSEAAQKLKADAAQKLTAEAEAVLKADALQKLMAEAQGKADALQKLKAEAQGKAEAAAAKRAGDPAVLQLAAKARPRPFLKLVVPKLAEQPNESVPLKLVEPKCEPVEEHDRGTGGTIGRAILLPGGRPGEQRPADGIARDPPSRTRRLGGDGREWS